jgi:hypothetical protein
MVVRNSIIMAIFITVYILNKFHIVEFIQYDHFLRWYFNDILAPLVLIPLFINIHIFTGLRRNDLPPCLFEVVIYFFVLSVFFEGIVPIYNNRAVADHYDILAYLVGSVVYFSFVGKRVYHLDWLPLRSGFNTK